MSDSVENKVVSMQFDNAIFESRLAETLKSLEKLQKSLDFSNSARGFDQISAASKHFDISSIAQGVDHISSKFSALGAIGFSVIQSLTQSVLGLGTHMLSLAKTDILGPIITGGAKRAENIEQAKFQFRGLGFDVEKGMQSALDAVRGTAFGLDEAAKAAAQLGASGIKVGDQMTSTLRGIAGAAAMTNSSFHEIADIFTSSAGTGIINNQDLGQFATRGLNAAAAIAPILHKTEAQIHEMAANGQLDFKTFADAMDKAFGKHATKANETYSGALANMHAAMSRLGASFLGPKMEQQRDLFNALTPVIDNVSAALQPLIKTFLDIRKVGIDKTIGFLKNIDLKNFKVAIANIAPGIMDIFKLFQRVAGIAKLAFRDIFPPSTTSALVKLSLVFNQFMDKMRIADPLGKTIRRIFQGVFATFELGWAILKETVKFFAGLIGGMSGVGKSGGFVLGIIFKIADAMVNLNEKLIQGGALHRFFIRLNEIVASIGPTIDKLKAKFSEIEKTVSDFVHKVLDKVFPKEGIPGAKVAADSVDNVGKKLDLLHVIADRLSQRWHQLGQVFSAIGKVLDKAFDGLKQWFSELGAKLAASMGPGDFDAAIDAVNVGLLAGIALLLKKFIDGGVLKALGGGFMDKVGGMFDGLTSKMQAMTASVKATTLLKIAAAIALLTASVVVLSMIDSDKLAKALTAMTVGFTQLVGTMGLLDQIIGGGAKGAAKLDLLAAGMIMLAGVMVIMAGAVKILASLSWDELARGLAGVTSLLGVLTAVTHLMSGDVSGMIAASIAMIAIATALVIMAQAVKSFADMGWEDMTRGLLGASLALAALVVAVNSMEPAQVLAAGIAMIPLATGILILSQAVKSFAEMSWGELAKGLVGLAFGIEIVAAATDSMNPLSILAAGVAMIPLATGLVILADAVRGFAGLSWGELAKGLVGLLGALLIITAAVDAMPPWLPLIAAGLLLTAIALEAIVFVVKSIATIKMGDLAKGIGGLAAVLLVLAVGVNAMSGAIVGAAALLVTAAALKILGEVLLSLSSLSLKELAIGIGAIAAVLLVLGLAALILEPVVPAMLGMGIALALIGAGFALFGAGAFQVAKALGELAKTGVAGVKALIESMKLLMAFGPTVFGFLARALVNFVDEILKGLPVILKGLTVVLSQILDTVIELAPKLAEVIRTLVLEGLKNLITLGPTIIATGLFILTKLLQGIRDNIENITQLVIDIIIKFADTLSANSQRIVDAAVNLLLSFTQAIANRASDIVTAGINMLVSFVEGLTKEIWRIIDAVGTLIATFITESGKKAGEVATAGADAIVAFIEGIDKNLDKIVTAGVRVVLHFLSGLGQNAVELARGAADIVVDFLNGMATAIREKGDDLRAAGRNIASALLEGLTGGLTPGSVVKTVENVGKGLINGLKGILHINSPSLVFKDIGEGIIEGLILGIGNDAAVQNDAVSVAETIVKNFEKTLSKVPDTVAGMDKFNPTITPVLDLSKVQAAARGIDGMMKVSSLTPDVSFDNARVISTDTAKQSEQAGGVSQNNGPTEIKFEQNNYSPKELSVNDIYRNTRSQIAMAKEELNIPS